MDGPQNRYFRRQRSRDSLERKMDNWIQTGRQVVDGVAGNRPGQRKGDNQDLFNRSNFEDVGRWVGDKIDWFFEEEEEDWLDNDYIQKDSKIQMGLAKKKRPLKAISLRGPKPLAPQRNNNDMNTSQDIWPDQSSFQVEKWQRKNKLNDNESMGLDQSQSDAGLKKRQLPRSNRTRRLQT